MNYFDSDMSNSTNTEDGNLYLRLRTMSHTIRAEDNSSTCTFITGKSITYTFTMGKSVTYTFTTGKSVLLMEHP